MEKDLVVLGGGPGGYTAAIRAAQLGAAVALIEKDRLGGTCLHRGCIPTKSLYQTAKTLNELGKADKIGINCDVVAVDIARVRARKDEIVEQLTAGIEKLLKANKIEVIKGTGRLLDKNTIEVKDDANIVSHVKAKKILLAPGSLPDKPNIKGIELPGVLTSDELLLDFKLPKEIIIIGGGVIGVEFAGIFQEMGTYVTVVEYMPMILPTLDGEISRRLAAVLKRKGIKIMTDTSVTEIQAGTNEEFQIYTTGKNGEDVITAGSILVSTGRKPNLTGLNLEGLGIEWDRKGIKADQDFATNIEGIYAIGDCIGGQMLAHLAAEQGIAAAEVIMGCPRTKHSMIVPACVFTFPEVAVAGKREEDLKAEGMSYESSKALFGANGKALTMGENEGWVKVLAEKETGSLLGVHILGPHASDLIHEAVLALENGLTAEKVIATIHAHPTLAECFHEAVMGIEKKAIHMAPRK